MKACLIIIWIVAFVSMAAGCATPMPAQEMAPDIPDPGMEETPPAQAPLTGRPPDRSPTVPAGAQTLVDLARADLAQQLGEKTERITLLSIEETQFPDASLGVPEPDKMYAQVITPGYVIRLGVGDKVYTYHGSGARVVLVPEDPTS